MDLSKKIKRFVNDLHTNDCSAFVVVVGQPLTGVDGKKGIQIEIKGNTNDIQRGIVCGVEQNETVSNLIVSALDKSNI